MLVFFHVLSASKDNQHDPTSEGSDREILEGSVKKALSLHGQPCAIFYSPYTIARESTKVLTSLTDKVPVISDPEIGRYYPFSQKSQYGKLNAETVKKFPVIDRNLEFFDIRLENRISRLFSIADTFQKPVWVMTHTCVLKRVAELYDIKKVPKIITCQEIFAIKGTIPDEVGENTTKKKKKQVLSDDSDEDYFYEPKKTASYSTMLQLPTKIEPPKDVDFDLMDDDDNDEFFGSDKQPTTKKNKKDKQVGF